MLGPPDIEDAAPKKSTHYFRVWFIITAAFFVLLIILPDFIYWALFSNFQEPLRGYFGGYTHYLIWLRDIFQERFSDNPYFWEHSRGTERFLLFQSIMRLIPPSYAIRIPMDWWYTIMKGASAFALFIELHLLLKNFGLERWRALGLTTFFFFFYGPQALLGPGAYSWFLVFFLAGILLLLHLLRLPRLWQKILCIGIANVLFTIHPVYFSLGVLIGGLWLLWFSIFDRTVRRWVLLGLWILFSLFNAKVFYSAHILGVSQADSLHESLAKMGVRFNHLFNLPLSSLRLAFAFIALAVLARAMFKKYSGESRSFQTPLFLSISFASLFIAINSNIVTGFSVVPDHYLLTEDFFTVILLGFAFYGLLPEMCRSRLRWLAAAFFLVLGLTAIALFYGRPWRSWLVVGGKVPLITGYALLVWRLYGAPIPSLILQKYAFIFVAIAVAFGLLFSWRLHASAFSYPKADERNRPVVVALRYLEPGVVLAPPDLSDIITLYTDHKVYWAGTALNFSGNNLEFKKRWLDAVRFYPESATLVGPDCVGAVGGVGNAVVPVQLSGFERAIIRTFSASWYNRLIVVPTSKFDTACTELRQESKRMPLTSAWQPAYRIDYVIFEKNKNGIPPTLTRNLKILKDAGEFSIYKFKQTEPAAK